MQIKLSSGKILPVEMHKVKIVQETSLPAIDQRVTAIEAAGFNTFLLRTRDIFLDMLTDSGTNAMSDNQLAAMMQADDAYAGSESFYRLSDAVQNVLGFRFVLPVHQGRAAEHLLAKTFVKPGTVVIMNYHFTTSKVHVELMGGKVLELVKDEALDTVSKNLFKGNMDLNKLQKAIEQYGAENVAYVRMEATTNLIGGQPFSIENLRQVKDLISKYHIPLVLDGSLLSENAFLVTQREESFAGVSIQEIYRQMMNEVDILYLSGRKSTAVRGGMIATNDATIYKKILEWLPVYEGFSTYGGMSTKEVEAMAVGIREMVNPHVAGSGAEFVEYFVRRMEDEGVPVVTPAGGLACHVDARRFLPHIPQSQYPAGALAAAIYIVSGVRAMERGTISMERDSEGNDVFADLELARLAVPRRTYTLSQIEYVVDRVAWLFRHRELVQGLEFVEEPPVLRFFFGKLMGINQWAQNLASAFKAEFGDHL